MKKVTLEKTEEDADSRKADAHHPPYQTESVRQGHDLSLIGDVNFVHRELHRKKGQEGIRVDHTRLRMHKTLIIEVVLYWLRRLSEPRIV